MAEFLPLIIEHDGEALTGLTSTGKPQRTLKAPQTYSAGRRAYHGGARNGSSERRAGSRSP